MAKWKGITADELIILREIQRINYQIRTAARTFGKDSRLYQQYETMLFPKSGTGLGSGQMHRHMKDNIVQLRTDRGAIRQYVIGSYSRDLQQLGRMQTVGQVKQQLVKAYEKKHGITEPITRRADIRAAVAEELQADKDLFAEVTEYLAKYYKLEDKLLPTGGEFESHQTLRDLTQGHWTSTADLRQMLDIIKKELNTKKRKIKKNFIEGL